MKGRSKSRLRIKKKELKVVLRSSARKRRITIRGILNNEENNPSNKKKITLIIMVMMTITITTTLLITPTTMMMILKRKTVNYWKLIVQCASITWTTTITLWYIAPNAMLVSIRTVTALISSLRRDFYVVDAKQANSPTTARSAKLRCCLLHRFNVDSALSHIYQWLLSHRNRIISTIRRACSCLTMRYMMMADCSWGMVLRMRVLHRILRANRMSRVRNAYREEVGR